MPSKQAMALLWGGGGSPRSHPSVASPARVSYINGQPAPTATKVTGYSGQCGRVRRSPVRTNSKPAVISVAAAASSSSEQHTARVVDTITKLLKGRDVLKKTVVQCFKRADPGTGSLSLQDLQQFRAFLSQVIGVPLEAFGDLVNTYLCFDFDGNGFMEVNEAYKLVKFHLCEYRKKLGGKEGPVDLPSTTLQEAGYELTEELGRGSQGVVHLATNSDGKQVCIKSLQKAQMTASGIEELQEEFQTLRNLDCGQVSRVFELFQDAQSYYMVLEPYFGGDFTTLLSRARAQGVMKSERWLQSLFRQCFDALAFLHQQAIMHCDIKEPNIMLKTTDFHNPQVVLIDFGVSRAMAAKANGMPSGTLGYMPPETLSNFKWFPRGDIFSMGVVIMQVLIDKIPPSGPRTTATPGGIFIEGCATMKEIIQATKTRAPPFHLMPAGVPGLTKLLRAVLTKVMQQRPTAPQVLKDVWFYEVPDLPSEPCPRAKSDWATIGITKSFLARPSVMSEDLPPAIAALQELHAIQATV